jgi:transposase
MKQNVYTVGIDLAKKIFHLVGTDTTGKIVWRKRLTRHALMSFMAQLPPVTIGLEACGGAHYWARQLRHQGHQVKLMTPQFVKPYVKSNKNDMRDAEAIAEAVTRPTMRFVPIKDVDQQDIQALHRVRERLIGERTALINEVHGLLHEYGIVMPKGVAKFRQARDRKGQAHSPEPGDILEVGEGVCRLGGPDRFIPRKARRLGYDASRVSASDDNSRDWPDHSDSAGRGRR